MTTKRKSCTRCAQGLRASLDATAMVWAADLANEGILLVNPTGEPLSMAEIAHAFESANLARARFARRYETAFPEDSDIIEL